MDTALGSVWYRLLNAATTRADRCALVLAMAVVMSPCTFHVDDVDAQLYQVVARHMVEDGTWTDLRYLPNVHPRFREHLPFGLWPFAAGFKVAGEWTLPFLGALFTLITLLVVAYSLRKAAGETVAAVALVLLGVATSFSGYAARARLDPPLILFATGAALLWLAPVMRASTVLASSVLAACAVAVKGPFGLLPLLSLGVGRIAWEVMEGHRHAAMRTLWQGLVCVGLAVIPVAAWLTWNRVHGDGTWWLGYVEHQLLASATGSRADGALAWWAPLANMVGHFSPAVLFLAFGAWRLWRGERDRSLVVLGVAVVVALVLLCFPGRKVWNHVLVIFPLAAMAAAVSVQPLLLRWERHVRHGVVGLMVVAVVAALSGAGRGLVNAPCAPSTSLAAALDAVPPGTPVGLITPSADWRMLAILAAERRYVPYPGHTLLLDAGENVALVREELVPAEMGSWREVARGGGWVVLRK